MRRGYDLSLANDFSGALEELQKARRNFLEAGNRFEADSIAKHFIAYSLFNTGERQTAVELLREVDQFTKENEYRWLNLLNLYWVAGIEENLELRSSEELNETLERILRDSLEIKDSYTTQQALTLIVGRNFFINQKNVFSVHLEKLLKTALAREGEASGGSSFRQKSRALSLGAEIIWSTSFLTLAREINLEGLSYARDTENDFFVIGFLINGAVLEARLGAFERAEKLLEEAHALAGKQTESEVKNIYLANIRLHLGHLFGRQNNFAAAEEKYVQAVEAAGEARPFLRYEALKSRLGVLQKLGRHAEVEQALPDVLAILDKYRNEILAEREAAAFFDNEQTVYDIAVRHYAFLKNSEKAYQYAEMSSSRNLLNWLGRSAGGEPPAKTFESAADSKNEKRFSPAEIRRKLDERVQIVQYAVLDESILIWLITKDKFRLEIVRNDFQELKAKVNRFRNLIERGDARDLEEIKTVSGELHRILIEPVAADLSENKQIVFIPSKFLFKLPFAALASSAKGGYLLESYPISYAPSANVLLLSTENARRKANSEKPETLLAFGNPAFDRNLYKDFDPLPAASEEVRRTAEFYENSKIYTGAEANKSNFLKNAGDFDLIHFAGHYIVREGQPLRSGLLLASDNSEAKPDNSEAKPASSGASSGSSSAPASKPAAGLLTNEELLKRKFSRPKLIVLSACETGVEDYFNGEGLTGLSRTFIALGIPLVLGSSWRVESEATARLLTDFHALRRAPAASAAASKKSLTTAEALRRAQVRMLRASTETAAAESLYAHPFYWASFAVYGGYADF